MWHKLIFLSVRTPYTQATVARGRVQVEVLGPAVCLTFTGTSCRQDIFTCPYCSRFYGNSIVRRLVCSSALAKGGVVLPPASCSLLVLSFNLCSHPLLFLVASGACTYLCVLVKVSVVWWSLSVSPQYRCSRVYMLHHIWIRRWVLQ